MRLLSVALIMTMSASAQEFATLSGKTVGAEGQPLKKTQLTLVQINGSGGSYAAISGDEGRFVFEALPSGDYLLLAERQGYLKQSYGANRRVRRGKTITLGPGEHRDLTFALTPQASISGKVLDDDGDPVAYATVYGQTADSANSMPVWQAISDTEGEYKLGGLGPGRYRIRAAPARLAVPTGMDLVTTYYPSAIEIVAGRNQPGTDIRLERLPVVRIKGMAVGPRVHVKLWPKLLPPPGGGMVFSGDPPDVISTITGSDGSFELPHVQAGSYTLLAITAHGEEQILARQPIEVSAHNVEGIVLTLSALSELRGTVITVGKPSAVAPNMQVTLMASDAFLYSRLQVDVHPDGTFAVPEIVPGRYSVSAYQNAPGSYLQAVRYGGRTVPGQDLDLSAGVAGGVELIFGTAAGEISGKVQAGDQPLSGGTVTIMPDPPRTPPPGGFPMANVDANGHSLGRILASEL